MLNSIIRDSIIALDPEYVFQFIVENSFIESAEIIGLWESQGINASDWLRLELGIDCQRMSHDSESSR